MASITQPAVKSAKSQSWLGQEPQFGSREFRRKKWWKWVEWEALLLIGMVAAIYFIRLPDMSIRGEESRWATVAVEMVRSGDWVVPRQQGESFLSRPPFGSWLIAVASLLRGECDVWAIRLPTVIATMLTSLLIYGYSRLFLSRLGAFTAGMAYATMGQVLQLGRVGETEAVFAFFVSASLLVWHWGYVQGWPGAWPWVAGYGLSAFGALAKGPQAPIYFVAATGIFLLIRREWRRLMSWSHLVGIAVFVLIIASWQVPFFLKMGWPGVHAVWASDTAMRIWEINPSAVAKHLVTYPLEIIGCTLPWSVFLLVFLRRDFRRGIGVNEASGVNNDPGPNRMVKFVTVCLTVTFPSCWVIPGAHGRYFMPLYPCMALLVGLVIERCTAADFESMLRKNWRMSLAGFGVVMVGLALAIVSASWLGFPNASLLIQERNFSLVYATCTLASVAFLWWFRGRSGLRWGFAVVCALAVYVGVTYDTVVMNFIVRKNGVTAKQVASLREQLPPASKLVSFGPIHHLFAYHFHDPIALQDWPLADKDSITHGDFFCFDRNKSQPIPFPWKEIAQISCDRDRTANPEEVVIVGRRLPLLAASIFELEVKSSLTFFRSSP